MVVKRIMFHAARSNLFPANQSACHQLHPTETVVLSARNNLVRAVDDNQVTILIMLNISAAFDTVDHNVLLSDSPVDLVSMEKCVNCSSLTYLTELRHSHTMAKTAAATM